MSKLNKNIIINCRVQRIIRLDKIVIRYYLKNEEIYKNKMGKKKKKKTLKKLIISFFYVWRGSGSLFFQKRTLSRGNIYLNPPLYFVIIFYFSTSIFFSSAPPQTKTVP